MEAKLCRFCCKILPLPGFDIFSPDCNLEKLINDHFPTTVAKSDDLPKLLCEDCFATCERISLFFQRIRTAETSLKSKLEEHRKKNSIESISEKINRLPNIRLQRIPPQSQAPPPVAPQPTLKAPPVVKVISVRTPSSTPSPTKVTNCSTPVKRRVSGKRDRSASDEDYSPRKRSPPSKKSPPKVVKSTPPVIPAQTVISLKGGPNYACQFCKNRYDTFKQLKAHLAENIKCKFGNTTCKICDKVYQNRKSFYAHSLTHTKKISCDECDKQLRNRSTLEAHKALMHSKSYHSSKTPNEPTTVRRGVIEFECHECNKKFAFKKQLIIHMQSHTKGHECPHCGQSSESSEALETHIASVHSGKPERPPDTTVQLITLPRRIIKKDSQTVTLAFTNF